MRLARLLSTFAVALSSAAHAADIRVMTSGAFTAPYKELVPIFERDTSHKVISAYGASQGGAADSIPSRLARGEPVDIVIMSGPALDKLIAEGKVLPGSRVDIVRSTIGASVRKGTPKPDISTVEALKNTLLSAKSVAYSASASGTYLSTELFPKLGIAEQMKVTGKRIESERVGTVVARGDAELGFQQVSELIPIEGLDYVGPLPPEVQQVTLFSAGIAVGAKEPEAAKALIAFFTSAASAPTIAKSGLEPVETK